MAGAARGLFDRLERGEWRIDPGASIAAHLAVLFQARRGSAPAARDFGRPDLTDLVHTWPEGVRAIERALRQLVERYEPRLVEVSVRAVRSEDPLVLAFQVSGRAHDDPRRAHRFVTEIDALGRCTVR